MAEAPQQPNIITPGEGRESPLQSSQGRTHVEDAVVSKVAGVAAQEIEGVRMGGGTSRALGGIMDSVTGGGGSGASRGVSVEVGQVEAAVDLTLAVEYGKNIPQLTQRVRRNVSDRIQNLVGLRVTEVNITVDDVYFPDEMNVGRSDEYETQEQRRVR
jgi:uncharacterized alkaline shock family protein YloU